MSTARDLVDELKTAPYDRAASILADEEDRAEEDQRVTVLAAARARLEEVAPETEPEPLPEGAEVLEEAPEGAWAQLIDNDTGKPVEVDGGGVVAVESVV